jgi:hypothetical protein
VKSSDLDTVKNPLKSVMISAMKGSKKVEILSLFGKGYGGRGVKKGVCLALSERVVRHNFSLWG